MIILNDSCNIPFNYLGVLNGCIEIYGDWLPRHLFGKCTAFCAILRMLYISLVVLLVHLQRQLKGRFSLKSIATTRSSDYHDELVFMDGVSASLPLFFLVGIPSIFYCHFPDKVNLLRVSFTFTDSMNLDLKYQLIYFLIFFLIAAMH